MPSDERTTERIDGVLRERSGDSNARVSTRYENDRSYGTNDNNTNRGHRTIFFFFGNFVERTALQTTQCTMLSARLQVLPYRYHTIE